jgi:hypothetical protein
VVVDDIDQYITFDLDIYILNLSSVDDGSLGELFTKLHAHCVILLEDIDAVDATQSRQRETVKSGQDEMSSAIKGKPRGRVSLSVLSFSTFSMVLVLRERTSTNHDNK